ncbi:MAG: hypothetical protein N4A72_15535 [Bacteroidales bacterium]|jgi:hypothetical protein|nr:hypothetical protein [Bacteroidales bacterium]
METDEELIKTLEEMILINKEQDPELAEIEEAYLEKLKSEIND